jgi:hypothetical protein
MNGAAFCEFASASDTASSPIGHPWAERTDRPQEQAQPELPPALMGQEMALASLTYAERKQKISRDKRYARYEHVLALHRAGMGQRAIGRSLQMSRRIVQRYLSSDGFPERAPGSRLRAPGKSKLDPYLGYLRERWSVGEHSGSHLFCEIKERGYTGSASLLRHVLGEWLTELPPAPRQGPPRKPRPSPKLLQILLIVAQHGPELCRIVNGGLSNTCEDTCSPSNCRISISAPM